MPISCYHTNKTTPNEDLKTFFAATHEKLRYFFGIPAIDDVSIFFFHNKQTIDAAFGEQNPPEWKTAQARYKTIFMLKKEAYVKIPGNNEKGWYKIITHELAHIYHFEYVGSGQIYPKWLNEGLACFLAKQEKKGLPVEDIFKIFSDDYNPYRTGLCLVSRLHKLFGKEKLLELVRASKYEDRKHFSRRFQEIYGEEYTKAGLRNLFSRS